MSLFVRIWIYAGDATVFNNLRLFKYALCSIKERVTYYYTTGLY